MKKTVSLISLTVISLFLTLLASEVALRGVRKKNADFLFFENLSKDERNLFYRYDETLGWFPEVRPQIAKYTGSRPIHIKNNSDGFRDLEPDLGKKPGIVFLGDSFVWGYDVEASERFTERLRSRLSEWSLYNFGVSGYGTDQEYLLMMSMFDRYKPKIVFLMFCTDNDFEDNSINYRYGAYFKPYFTVSGGTLNLKGVPVPFSQVYFLNKYKWMARSLVLRLMIRGIYRYWGPKIIPVPDPTLTIIANLNDFLKSRGTILIVGLQSTHDGLEGFLKKRDIQFLSLDNDFRYPEHGRHWTPEGHAYVSDKVYHFLTRHNYAQ